ncbi:hypothetical protein V2G26_003473, partial [Clonostachys chloroleuca]
QDGPPTPESLGGQKSTQSYLPLPSAGNCRATHHGHLLLRPLTCHRVCFRPWSVLYIVILVVPLPLSLVTSIDPVLTLLNCGFGRPNCSPIPNSIT